MALKTLYDDGGVTVTERAYGDGTRSLEIGVDGAHFASAFVQPHGKTTGVRFSGLAAVPAKLVYIAGALAAIDTAIRSAR